MFYICTCQSRLAHCRWSLRKTFSLGVPQNVQQDDDRDRQDGQQDNDGECGSSKSLIYLAELLPLLGVVGRVSVRLKAIPKMERVKNY